MRWFNELRDAWNRGRKGDYLSETDRAKGRAKFERLLNAHEAALRAQGRHEYESEAQANWDGDRDPPFYLRQFGLLLHFPGVMLASVLTGHRLGVFLTQPENHGFVEDAMARLKVRDEAEANRFLPHFQKGFARDLFRQWEPDVLEMVGGRTPRFTFTGELHAPRDEPEHSELELRFLARRWDQKLVSKIHSSFLDYLDQTRDQNAFSFRRPSLSITPPDSKGRVTLRITGHKDELSGLHESFRSWVDETENPLGVYTFFDRLFKPR